MVRVASKMYNLAVLFPEIAMEWNSYKNKSKKPSECTPGSGFKAWWTCKKCGSDFSSPICARTGGNNKKGTGCPYCAKPAKKVNHTNCLSTTHPELTKEWHPEKNGHLSPDQVTCGQEKKIWWICKVCSHEWPARLPNRSIHNRGCPKCAGKYVEVNDSFGALFPKILEEWDYEKNKKLDPFALSKGSNRSVWWVCKNGHEFKNTIDKRVNRFQSCPTCRGMVSHAQARLFFELKTIIPKLKMRHFIEKKEADIAFLEKKLVIEYDGSYWHQAKYKSDLNKNMEFQNLGYETLRLREPPLSKINEHDIILGSEAPIKKQDINRCVRWLLKRHFISKKSAEKYISGEGFFADEQYKKFLSGLPSPQYESSLAYKFPEVAAEFHPNLNDPLTPKDFLPYSNKSVWWKCKNGCEWEDTINHRTNGNRGCRYCSASPKTISPSNNLEARFPKIAQQWNYELNVNLKPNEIFPGSHKRVWWKCPAGHDYRASPANRTKGRNCGICAGKVVTKENNLKAINPSLAAEWDLDKNNPLKPEDVVPGSNKRVWWKCSICSHSWITVIASRNKGAGCKPCSHKKKIVSNKYVIEGIEYQSHQAIADAFNLSRRLVSRRLSNGWTLNQTVGLEKRVRT